MCEAQQHPRSVCSTFHSLLCNAKQVCPRSRDPVQQHKFCMLQTSIDPSILFYSILLYSTLLYSILVYSTLLYSILFYSVLF